MRRDADPPRRRHLTAVILPAAYRHIDTLMPPFFAATIEADATKRVARLRASIHYARTARD